MASTIQDWVAQLGSEKAAEAFKAYKRLEETAMHDWELSHRLDLSDAGLLKDLKKREGLSPDKLVLEAGNGRKGKGKG